MLLNILLPATTEIIKEKTCVRLSIHKSASFLLVFLLYLLSSPILSIFSIKLMPFHRLIFFWSSPVLPSFYFYLLSTAGCLSTDYKTESIFSSSNSFLILCILVIPLTFLRYFKLIWTLLPTEFVNIQFSLPFSKVGLGN